MTPTWLTLSKQICGRVTELLNQVGLVDINELLHWTKSKCLGGEKMICGLNFTCGNLLLTLTNPTHITLVFSCKLVIDSTQSLDHPICLQSFSFRLQIQRIHNWEQNEWIVLRLTKATSGFTLLSVMHYWYVKEKVFHLPASTGRSEIIISYTTKGADIYSKTEQFY